MRDFFTAIIMPLVIGMDVFMALAPGTTPELSAAFWALSVVLGLIYLAEMVDDE